MTVVLTLLLIPTATVATAATGPPTTPVATTTVPSSRVPTEALQRFSLLLSNEEGFATTTATALDTYYVCCYRRY